MKIEVSRPEVLDQPNVGDERLYREEITPPENEEVLSARLALSHLTVLGRQLRGVKRVNSHAEYAPRSWQNPMPLAGL